MKREWVTTFAIVRWDMQAKIVIKVQLSTVKFSAINQERKQC